MIFHKRTIYKLISSTLFVGAFLFVCVQPLQRGEIDHGFLILAIIPFVFLFLMIDDVFARVRIDSNGIYIRKLPRSRLLRWGEIQAVCIKSNIECNIGEGTFQPHARIQLKNGQEHKIDDQYEYSLFLLLVKESVHRDLYLDQE